MRKQKENVICKYYPIPPPVVEQILKNNMDKFNSIDNRRISEENELAEIAAHGPPPLPPIPPPPPREKTHQDYINEATLTTNKADSEVVSEWTLPPSNKSITSYKQTYHYMKQLCNYAKISIDHIYKVHASLIHDDFNAYDQKIRYFLTKNHPAIGTDIKRFSDDINKTDTSTYCNDFTDNARIREALNSILVKIQDTFNYGIECSTIIKHGIDGLSNIVDKLDIPLPKAKNRIITLLIDGVEVLNKSNSKFSRDILAIQALVQTGFIDTSTPVKELKKLLLKES
jgi:hypothetical protein